MKDSQTSQSQNPVSDSWPDPSFVRARLSKVWVVSNSSCQFFTSPSRINLNLHNCHSLFAMTDSGPKEGSWRYSNRCSGFPSVSVILCKSSNSWGVWIERSGSCFGSCQKELILPDKDLWVFYLLTAAVLVAVASFCIWANANVPHNFRCFSAYEGETYQQLMTCRIGRLARIYAIEEHGGNIPEDVCMVTREAFLQAVGYLKNKVR